MDDKIFDKIEEVDLKKKMEDSYITPFLKYIQ